MSNIYLDKLKQYDEWTRSEAEHFGLPLPEVVFHVLQAEEIYDIAARDLPGRFSHYQFGRAYQESYEMYRKGRGRLYELVINTDPVHAYLLDGNSLIDQLTVMAHVQGHAAFFNNSKYFEPADKLILSRVANAANRINDYINEYGRTRVENFIDDCMSIAWSRPLAILQDEHKENPPEWKDFKYDLLFPEETAKRRAQFEKDKEAYRNRFPQSPQRDILKFIEQYSRRLDDWERDIISIIRMETEYFIPAVHTKIFNEGLATLYHFEIIQKLMAEKPDEFTSNDFIWFNHMHAGVVMPRVGRQQLPDSDQIVYVCQGYNPYLLGWELIKEIREICENPTDEQKEVYDWAGQIAFTEKLRELVHTHDDIALIANFISPKVCEKAKIFMKPRSEVEYKDLHVTKDECDKVRDNLIHHKMNIVPAVDIIDADYQNQGIMLLKHDEVKIGDEYFGLDEEYTRGVLPHIVRLWKRPVFVDTIADVNGKPVSIQFQCHLADDQSERIDVIRK